MGIKDIFDLKLVKENLTVAERQKLPLIKIKDKIYLCVRKKKNGKNTPRY